jgi:acetylornithine deacetylase
MRMSDLELLGRLVAFDTTSHRPNLSLVSFLQEYLAPVGARLTVLPSSDGTKANLLVETGPDPTPERAGLTLSGHSDAVPAGDGWATDPFALSARDGRLHGRGACDMKGFLALATNLAAEAAGRRLRHPLVLLFTYDEEVGTLGARRFAETWPEPERLPRAAIVGEPTMLRAVGAHKGIVEIAIVVAGRSAHSAYPHLGRSAIEPAARIATALAAERECLAAERPTRHALFPEVPYVALNVGTIRGGTAPNVVPDRCELTVTLRPLPGDDAAALTTRIEAAVRAAAGDAPVEITVRAESPPLDTAWDAPVLRAVLDAVGQKAPDSASFATDAGWLQRLGLDCVLFGPGDIAVAHQPDEYVPAEDLVRGRRLLEGLVRRFCG